MKDMSFDEWMESHPRAKFRPILYPSLSETDVGKWWDSRTPEERLAALRDFAWSEETLKVENGPYSINWGNHTDDTRQYILKRRGEERSPSRQPPLMGFERNGDVTPIIH